MRFTATVNVRRAIGLLAVLPASVRQHGARCVSGVAAVAATLLALSGPAAAQWWNPFDRGPVYLEPPPDYGDPPPVYRPRLPDAYDAPPPGYDDLPPDTGFVPDPDYGNRAPGWREGRRPVPPADLLYEEDLDPGAAPRGYSNRRDRDRRLPPEGDWYEDRDSAAVPDPYGMDAYEDPYARGPASDPYGQDPYGRDPYGQDPYAADPYGPPPGTRSGPPADDGWGAPTRRRQAYSVEALEALSVYGPAKRSAVAVSDAFQRTTALRQVNTWLISQAARPATAESIRAIDRLLGIDVSDPATTALPPAGTSVERPKAGKSDPAMDAGIDRIAAYANDKADALDRGGPDGEDARSAETRLADGLDGGLEPKAIAGLDAYLGLGEDAALVQAPEAAPGTTDGGVVR
ncbi:hypothetical protein [Mongoliimonas terrestris]|uniref:hypothetical protein n=1 Tax=Mongoliimonas terrestris TaxID=1709001 RepID=UPI0009498BE7|nr:hypothetical protein [Mongoliimonas terrestris]